MSEKLDDLIKKSSVRNLLTSSRFLPNSCVF